jgi:hypothetical protein
VPRRLHLSRKGQVRYREASARPEEEEEERRGPLLRLPGRRGGANPRKLEGARRRSFEFVIALHSFLFITGCLVCFFALTFASWQSQATNAEASTLAVRLFLFSHLCQVIDLMSSSLACCHLQSSSVGRRPSGPPPSTQVTQGSSSRRKGGK